MLFSLKKELLHQSIRFYSNRHCILKEDVSISSRSAQEQGYPVTGPAHNLCGGNGSTWMQRLNENNVWPASRPETENKYIHKICT